MTTAIDGLVATIWIRLTGAEELTISLDTVVDAPPYDRPLLARLLREMADRLDEVSAERGSS